MQIFHGSFDIEAWICMGAKAAISEFSLHFFLRPIILKSYIKLYFALELELLLIPFAMVI